MKDIQKTEVAVEEDPDYPDPSVEDVKAALQLKLTAEEMEKAGLLEDDAVYPQASYYDYDLFVKAAEAYGSGKIDFGTYCDLCHVACFATDFEEPEPKKDIWLDHISNLYAIAAFGSIFGNNRFTDPKRRLANEVKIALRYFQFRRNGGELKDYAKEGRLYLLKEHAGHSKKIAFEETIIDFEGKRYNSVILRDPIVLDPTKNYAFINYQFCDDPKTDHPEDLTKGFVEDKSLI